MVTKEENILLAAEKLFAEKGFDATSTREISAAAGVNVSMISYYFGSKEQLLEKLFEYRMREGSDFIKGVLANESLTEWDKLMAVVNLYIGKVSKMSDFYSVMQTEQLTNKNPNITEFLKNSKTKYLSTYSKLLEDGLQKGIFTKKPKVELLHATIIGTVFYAFNGIDFYREYEDNAADEETFKANFFEDLKSHLKTILKDLLGYEKI